MFDCQEEADVRLISSGPDRNHFSEEFSGRGVAWKRARPQTLGASVSLAHAVYVETGREIIDATQGGDLRIFPRTRLKSLSPRETREMTTPLSNRNDIGA